MGENQFILKRSLAFEMNRSHDKFHKIYLYMYNWENIIPNINIFIVTDIQSQKNNNKKLTY